MAEKYLSTIYLPNLSQVILEMKVGRILCKEWIRFLLLFICLEFLFIFTRIYEFSKAP